MFLFIGIFMLVLAIALFAYCYSFFQRLYKLFTDNKKRYIFLSVLSSLFLIVIAWPFFNVRGILIIHFIFICMFLDVIYFIFVKLLKKNIKVLENEMKRGIISIVIASLLIGYGYYNMNHVYQKDYHILSNKIDSLKIGALSDLHYGISIDLDELQGYCNKIEKEGIDIFVLAGDIVDERTTKEEMIQVCEVLGEVKSTYGTYFIFGNHDPNFYSNVPQYTKEELIDNLKKNNINILEDQIVEIGEDITLIGRKDKSISRMSVSELSSGIDMNDFILMLDHQPAEFKEKAESKIDLSISGHTHAGQIWPGKYFIDIFKTSDASYGYKQIEDFSFITTSGIAGWGFPIRTQNHCEYLIIEIKGN